MLFYKLFFLGVRQLAKPVAERAKQAARNSEAFKGVVAGVGQGLHRMNVQVTRSSELEFEVRELLSVQVTSAHT